MSAWHVATHSVPDPCAWAPPTTAGITSKVERAERLHESLRIAGLHRRGWMVICPALSREKALVENKIVVVVRTFRTRTTRSSSGWSRSRDPIQRCPGRSCDCRESYQPRARHSHRLRINPTRAARGAAERERGCERERFRASKTHLPVPPSGQSAMRTDTKSPHRSATEKARPTTSPTSLVYSFHVSSNILTGHEKTANSRAVSKGRIPPGVSGPIPSCSIQNP